MVDGSRESMRLAAGTRLGSYAITRCIGEGGMGVVYEGLHEGLGKRVAIKTLSSSGTQSKELVARFVREGKAAAKIRHPNVVDVVDVAVHDGTPYLVMEYLEGEDLGARMEHEAPMGTTAIADLIIPVVSALCAAHEAGIVHRDLKPDNIFITRGTGGVLEPKLVDFGISKLDDGESLHLTGTNAILGTPYYMSPEQAGSSKSVDHRSDIFSLGVILYQCATHQLPFKGDSLYKLLGEILHSEPPPVRSVAKDVPAAFELVITRAMQKDPAARFQTAAELGAALLPFASPRVRLNYEHELGSLATPSIRVAAPKGGRGRMVALVLFLGVVVVVAGGLLLRNAGGRRDEVTRSGPAPKLSPASQPLEAQQDHAAPALTPPSPLKRAVDAGAAEHARLSAAEANTMPTGASEPSERVAPSAGHERSGERASGAGGKRRGAHSGRGPDTAGAAIPTAATPAPDRAAPSGAVAPGGEEELFRDRK